MVHVGIKYCGGCQEYYDRIGSARYIQTACKDYAIFSPVRECTVYDLILVVCGCSVQCPDVQNFRANYGKIIVCGPEDVDDAIEKIRLLNTQEAMK